MRLSSSRLGRDAGRVPLEWHEDLAFWRGPWASTMRVFSEIFYIDMYIHTSIYIYIDLSVIRILRGASSSMTSACGELRAASTYTQKSYTHISEFELGP